MTLSHIARAILHDTFDRVRIADAVPQRMRFANGTLHLGDLAYPLATYRRVLLIAIGKAAVPLCETALPILTAALTPDQTLEGIVVGTTLPSQTDPRIRFLRGGHPHPDQASKDAALDVLELLTTADASTFVLYLISGGGSAMFESPLDLAITLAETVQFHSALVRSGLPITQMNALRKHFSSVKGGRLALAAANAAAQCTLLVSDVPEAALDVISSGPSLPDPSTIADCLSILATHPGGLDLPRRVQYFFQNPALPETPKPNHPAFQNARWVPLLSSADLCTHATILAESHGFHVVVDNSCDDQDYRAAARHLIDRITALRHQYRRVCLLSAGELSVKIGSRYGAGGRNQQFVLECARILSETTSAAESLPITVLSAGSDGIDGHSPAAGAIADRTTWSRATAIGLDPQLHLENFDSFPLFEALEDAIVTGPTGNNLRDLRILLSAEA